MSIKLEKKLERMSSESSKPKAEKLKLRTLDLFTGMGGMTLGLKPICRTVGFCDNNSGAQALIKRLIKAGHFPKVPVLEDIRDVTAKEIKKVDLLTAGFPCQDLSSFGKQLGLFGGERSILVKEVFRLVGQMRPAFVFLENVPRIVRDEGYPQLLNALLEEGYRVAHLFHDAASLGGWHRRQRWFLLAYHPRRAAKFRPCEHIWMKSLARHLKVLQSNFEQAQRPTCDGERGRCRPMQGELHLLGNSVVPAVLCASFAELLQRVWAPSNDIVRYSFKNLKSLDFRALKYQGITLHKISNQYELQIFPDDPKNFNDRKCSLAGNMWRVSPRLLIPHPIRKSQRYLPEPEDELRPCVPTLRTGSMAGTPHTSISTRTKNDFQVFLFASSIISKAVRKLARFPLHRISRHFGCQIMGFPHWWMDENPPKKSKTQ